MKPQVEILPDATALIARSLDLIIDKIARAITERGQATLVLSGGNTPKPLYEALAKQTLPWPQLHIFWGDERYVPREHPDSNQGMARHAWLDHIEIPPTNLHPMPTLAGDPQRDAENYENELARFFHLSAGEFPRFDVILLGLGDDAHTASLFSHTLALQVCDRLITVGNKDGQPRLTFTIPLINQARNVIFLVAGASKQNALHHIFAPSADPHTYPARFIQPQGDLYWLLDAASGEKFTK